MKSLRRSILKTIALGVGSSLLPYPLTAQNRSPATRLKPDIILPDSYKIGRTLYHNPLSSEADVKGFRLESDATVAFPKNRLRLENERDADEGQDANFVFWCPEDFPSDLEVTWDFLPVREPGLCIMFFAAKGRKGEDLFDPKLARRTGPYKQYHHGDINALHVSYFRRRALTERAFHTCNLRKSHGFHLVSQGADPLPSVADVQSPYRVRLVKYKTEVAFFINDLPIFRWVDDGKTYGDILGGGKIGFRQMAPLIGEYANLTVKVVEGIASPHG